MSTTDVKNAFNRCAGLLSLVGYIVYSLWDLSQIEWIFSVGMSAAVFLYLLPFSICLYLGIAECTKIFKRIRKL